MSEVVSFVVELSIKPGQLDNFKSLGRELVESAQANEPGTLIYEYFLSDDGGTCELYERYADSASALQHLGTLQQRFLERLLGTADVKRVDVYGSPSPDLHGVLSGLGATFKAQLDGFAR